MSRLSENFATAELCISAEFPELAAKITPGEDQLQRAEFLAQSCLQALRDEFGPLHVLSWLRSPKLNQAVGGSPDSDHLYGSAADIYSPQHSPVPLWEFAIGACLPYRQVIVYPDAGFLHLSVNVPGRAFKHEAKIAEGSEYLTLNSGQVEKIVREHWRC